VEWFVHRLFAYPSRLKKQYITDFIATLVRTTGDGYDYPFGAWVRNRESGLRLYLYSLNHGTNPTRYSTLNDPDFMHRVHRIGTIWAQMLWDVCHELIRTHGFSSTLFPPMQNANSEPQGNDNFYRPLDVRPTRTGRGKIPLVPRHGNTLMLQLVIVALKLTPCRTNFINGRDAIIQADSVLTGGENYCVIWRGFASRGLGPKARLRFHTPLGDGYHEDDFSIPLVCR
jgi:extracellular elastinolytic metalloproteinase